MLFAAFLHKSHISNKYGHWDMDQNALGQSNYRILKLIESLGQNNESLKNWKSFR